MKRLSRKPSGFTITIYRDKPTEPRFAPPPPRFEASRPYARFRLRLELRQILQDKRMRLVAPHQWRDIL